MDDINDRRQLQIVDEGPGALELIEQTISLTVAKANTAIDLQPPDQRDDRQAAPVADTCRPQIDPYANNSPKAIVMISAPPRDGNVTAAAADGGGGGGGGGDGGNASDNQMASICRTGPDNQPSKATRTSHTDDEKPTHIDSVTLKCDLNDYLINLTNIRCSLAQSYAAPYVSQPVGEYFAKLPHHDIISASDTKKGRDGKLGPSTYTCFDELVRCVERERQWVRCGVLPHRMPRLRLCGGGEDSINNGTSAWGTPPGAASNGTLSAWGVLPNQQQQAAQQSLPPSAWGTINNSNPGNSTNNNNAGSGSVGSTGNAANGNGNTANTGASVGQQQRAGGPSAADPNSNKVNTQSASAPNAWNATVNHGRHGAPSGTNATANVANNNGNHHHGHNNNQQQQQQQHQQQAANMGAGNNNGAGNGTATKQLEVLNTMRDALFSQDGWGCQHVNQDTNWEVPGSPEPQSTPNAGNGGGGGAGPAKPDGAGAHGAGPNGSWKPQTMNNGTELWETNLRNGGGGPAHLQQQQQQQQAQQHLAQAKNAPWVPANNLGGTWMEDDDSTGGHPAGVPEAAANVWNGSAAAIVAGAVPLGPAGGSAGVGQAPGWGALNNGNVVAAPPTAGGAGTVGGGMWPSGGNASAISTAGGPTATGSMNNAQMGAIGVKKDLNEWGGAVGPIGSVGSGAVGIPGGGGVGPGIPAQGGWDARSASTAGTLPMVGGAVNGQSAGGFNMNASIGGGAPSDGLGNRIGGGDLRGDPRGISGRLNGAAAGSMWGAGVPEQRSGTSGAGGVVMPGAGVAGVGGQQWGGNGNGGPNKLPTNWDDGRPSSLDDASGGGALWGQGSAAGLSRQNSTGWKDVADVMMRPGGGGGGVGGAGGGPMQRNQQGGGTGPFGPVPVPSATASGVRVAAGTGGALSLGKDGMWGGPVQGIVRNGSWEDQTPGGGGGGWGDEKGGGGAPWNMDLASNGAGGMVAGGWNKTPTTPKSAGIPGWPDPGDLNSSGGAGMDWGLGGKPSGVGSNKSQPLSNPLEFIRASKEYRLLCEMGHKKEDVEFALRTTNMNIEEAMELLRHGAAVAGLTTGWRRTLSEDHTGGGGLGMGFDGTYAGRIPPLNHATSGLSYSQNNQNMLSNLPGGGPGVGGLGLDGTGPANLVALNNLKYLSQGAGGGGGGATHPSFNHNSLLPPGGRGPNQQPPALQQQQQQQLAAAAAAQPTNQQLRVLVQQIQLAVQNGFLNHQILNQPLAPQTFILLNQLLTHIKQMQLTQSNLARSGTTGGVSAVQLSLAINKHKTQIAQLQQQIAAQQSIYLKQQQQQQQQGHQGSMGPPPPLMQSNPNAGLGMDFMRQQQQQQQQQQQDLMALQSTFGEMALGKDSIITSTGSVFPPPVVPLQQQQQQQQQQQHAVVSAAPGNVIVSGGSTSQQSRLNQWKLPSLEKDPTASKDDLTDFSRAPGPSTAKSALTTTTTNTNISSLGLVQDGTWTTGRTNLADGWPEQTGDADSKDWTTNNTSPQDSSAFTDLVPEFEPGKPWKGTQLKIEDDPSITPGSVARSPLSIATAKDSELFGGVGGTSVTEKTSPIPADGGGLNLTSSAWSFNTASLTSVAGGTGGNKPMAGKSVWSDSSSTGSGSNVAVSSSAAAVDVWCTPIVKPSATRGPPPGLGGATANKNGNGGSIAGAQQRPGAGWATGGTSWLLLKNLTSQIDASTLRTLCMQHGPILNFHSYPAHGLALCRYATREEAAKAQQALNNCTLGSSTISAECPGSESEVQTYLQQLSGAATSNVVAVSSSASSLTSPSWRQERTPSSSGGDTWGSGWAIGGAGSSGTGAAANLWAPLDAGTDNGTPTSLNSFLPDSLLGPELN